jgi:hypothetical protein
MSSQYPTPQSYKDALENILGEAKNIYETKKGLGFQTYGQPRIAGFSPEEQAAMSGIAGLVGMGQQYFAPAAGLTAGLADRFTADTAQQYMSPYQQAVVDVEKREAIRQAERGMQDIGAAAQKAGSFGGSRQAILEAEAGRNLQQRLGDIQTRGSQAAFETAQRAFEAQKSRERQAASGLASLGQQAPRQALAELTALSGIGEAQRGMNQQALDLAYQDFMKQQQYPYDLLSQYQSTVYGYPYQSFAQYQPTPRPSAAQNLAGVLGAVGKIAGPSGFGFFNTGGRVAYRSKGGLSGMVKKMNVGSQVGGDPFDRPPQTEPETISSDPAMSARNALLAALTESATGLTEYTAATKAALQEKQRISEEQKARLERQESPINYISDLLLGFAGADPEAGLAGQVAEAATFASANREQLQDEIMQIQSDLAAGKLSQAEAALKIRQAQTELLSDVYDVAKGDDIESADINALRKIAADRLGAVYDDQTGIIEGTADQKAAITALLREMTKAFQRGGFDAALAVAERGASVSTTGDTGDGALVDDAAAGAAEDAINKIQNLK